MIDWIKIINYFVGGTKKSAPTGCCLCAFAFERSIVGAASDTRADDSRTRQRRTGTCC